MIKSDVVDQPRAQVILDPSALFTEEALEWLGDGELRRDLIISAGLAERLAGPNAARELSEFLVHLSNQEEMVERVRTAIVGIGTFSRTFAPDIPPEAARIATTLIANNRRLGDILADEWIYLVTQSWGIFGSIGMAITRLRDAGARVIEIAEERWRATLEALRARIPSPILGGAKRVVNIPGPATRFVVACGGIALGLLVPLLADVLHIADAALAGLTIVAGDP
jgi:hypothetical protein